MVSLGKFVDQGQPNFKSTPLKFNQINRTNSSLTPL